MPLPQDSQNVFTDASSTGFVETFGSGALGAPGAVLATVQGTTNLVISPPAYGNAALNGLTLILNVNGGGNVTFTVNVATNFASQAAFLAALLTTFTSLSSAVITASGVLSLTATTSIAVVSSTLLPTLGLAVQTSTGTSALHYANNLGLPTVYPGPIVSQVMQNGVWVPAFRGVYSVGGGSVKIVTPYQAAQVITLGAGSWWTQKAILGLTVYAGATDVVIGF